jgi:hypothetical protein
MGFCDFCFFLVNKLESVDWRVDYILSSSLLQDVQEPSVQLRLTLSDGKSIALSIDGDKFCLLHKDLKQALKLMQNL